ncbi:hypothetical protein [Pseudomonas sp. LT1P18]|uniref:hypothetical protein n=1 Tax=Pseudomonas arabinosi TaxID=3398357 RepID=UPI0039EF2978
MTIEKPDVNKIMDSLTRYTPPLTPPPPPPSPYVNGLWYNGKTIKIDGWVFESCRFDNCTLIVTTPHFSLINCYLDITNTIMYQGSILSIIKLYNLRSTAAVPPDFSAIRNPDGTVTVGG